MTINDKIKQILIDKNFTPSYFADEIGVQRSSISHILSGRNRPSFDIIQKIIRRFPELGYEWIMEEEPKGGNKTNGFSQNNRNSNSIGRLMNDRYTLSTETVPYTTSTRSQRNEIPPTVNGNESIIPSSSITPESNATNPEKRVERILIFYTDGSFREYTPMT